MVVARIRQLLESKNLTPTQFADLIGVGRPVVSHIMSERNKPSLEVVQRISDAFPDISLPWLLKGTGTMLDEPEAPITSPASESEPVAVAASPSVALTPASNPTPTPPPTEVVQPEATPVATPLVTAARAAAPAPLASGAPSLAAPAPLQPFRAPRFVPGSAATPTPPLQAELPKPLPPPEVAAAPAETALPAPTMLAAAASPLAEATASSAPLVGATVAPAASLPPSTPIEAAIPSFLAEPGKAIRRIVIFYRDGSFADFQPE